MKASLSELPPNINSEYLLIDLLLKDNRIEEAIEHLKMVVDAFPKETSARYYLEKLNSKLWSKR